MLKWIWKIVKPEKQNYTMIRIEIIKKMLEADPVAKLQIFNELKKQEHKDLGCILCS
jgi:hypothetical protein